MEAAAAKVAQRALAIARRAACDPAAVGVRLAAHVLRDLPPPPKAIVAGFWPMAHEIDIRLLLEALAERGQSLCLPETPRLGLPLIFRAWRPGDALAAGRFGTMHPLGEIVRPDFLLVPLLAYDAAAPWQPCPTPSAWAVLPPCSFSNMCPQSRPTYACTP
jgi:5-formyltetrahydrofolate cyclo-ligase